MVLATVRVKHPVTGRVKPHLGTDYAAPKGTPILSTANGIITEARYKRNNGNYVKVRHNSTYTTQYLHMSKIKSGIRPGVFVKQGEVIGYVGSTGLATGPHVVIVFGKMEYKLILINKSFLIRPRERRKSSGLRIIKR